MASSPVWIGERPDQPAVVPREGTVQVPDSITIIDDRTGKQITVPIDDGVFPSSALRELDPDLRMYDPAYLSTAACAPAVTFSGRRRRHPALPGLPHRAAGRAVDLPRGRLPPPERRAPER